MPKFVKTGYLNIITKNIEKLRGNAKTPHPRHCNVTMQAHHLISAKSAEESGLEDELIGLDYEINALNNLAFIPSTLQGACHLEVQLHRGDHKSADPDAYDWDKAHPYSYHSIVGQLVQAEFKKLKKKVCKMSRSKAKKETQERMDKLSRKVAEMINNHDVSLTRISSGFAKEKADFGMSGVGCRGVDSVKDAAKSAYYCPVERNHYLRQGPNQSKEHITYKKRSPRSPYKLEVGK